MRDNRDQQPEEAEPPGDDLVPDEDYPVDRLRARVTERLGGRPFTVYLVLFAGAATLLLLLAVVWISATGDKSDDELFCTEIAPADARAAVLDGQVERVNVLVDSDQPTDTLTGIQLRFRDQTCRQTPQGADIREALFSIIGAVSLYNNYSESSVSVRYQGQDIHPELLASSTPTVLATSTPMITATVAPTTSPTAEASPVLPTATEATPIGTATVLPTVTATVLPTIQPTVTATLTTVPATVTATPTAQNQAPAGSQGG